MVRLATYTLNLFAPAPAKLACSLSVKMFPFAKQRSTIYDSLVGSLKKRRKAKINKHKRRKQLRANRHKKRTWQK